MAAEELKGRRKLFVDHYLGVCRGNATAAAEAAGYKFPAQEGCRLLKAPVVKDAIEERLMEVGITRERVLSTLADILSVDVGGFFEVYETPEGARELRLRSVDGVLAGPTGLLRAVTAGRYGVRVEAYDKLKAVTLIGRFLGLWGGLEAEEAGEFDDLAKAILESAKRSVAE